jgi:hypothetical protein
MKSDTELARVEPPHPLTLLEKALDRGVTAEQLGQFMDLADRHKKNEAAEQFANAITKFQSICHTILKRRTAAVAGKFSYQFATFDDIMAEVGPALAECGLAVTFQTSQNEKTPQFLNVTCLVRCGIHVESTNCMLPIPAMTVNDTQRFGAAVSYGKRYALCAALNIVVTDQDNDAAGLIANMTEVHQADLQVLIDEKNVNLKLFLDYASEASKYPCASLATIPDQMYPKLMDMLRRKAARRREDAS